MNEMMKARTAALRQAGRVLCLCGAGLGALTLMSWAVTAEIARTFVGGRPAMMPNSALALTMIGLAAGISAGQIGRFRALVTSGLAAGALAIGALTLVEYASGWDFGIDQWLFSAPATYTFPGRPSPLTATAVILAAAALLVERRWARAGFVATEWLTFGSAFIAFVSIVDHLFGAGLTLEMEAARAVGVALPTAIGLLLIGSGVLLRDSDAGTMRLATSSGPGGILVRRLGVVAIVGPPLLGVAAKWGIQAAGFNDLPLTLAVMTSVGIPVALLPILVTARKIDRMHTALDASREQSRVLVEDSVDGFFVADLDGHYSYVNAAGCRMLGWAPDEIIGRTIVDLIPPDETARFAESRSLLMKGRTETAEWHLKARDGTYVPVEVSAKILPDGRWQGIVRDISRRKAAEKAAQRLQVELRQAVERLRFVAEAGEILGASLDTQDVVGGLAGLAARTVADCCVVELADDEGGIIRLRADARNGSEVKPVTLDRLSSDSARSSEWFGLSRPQPVLVDPVDDEWLRSRPAGDPIEALVRELRAGSLIKAPILIGARRIGTMLLLAVRGGRRYGDADLQMAIDVARRTALAVENGRLYRAAQAATEARDAMLGVVAHDLRSPLAAAQVAAELLAQHVPEDRRERSRKAAETVRRSIRFATRLVQDLLDVTRIEAGRLELDLRDVDPQVLAQHALDTYVPLAAAASVQLGADVPSGLAPVLADADRIQQVFGNLLDNALKFTPAGGKISLVVQRAGDGVRFSVADTGAGISAEHLPRVFERFWQAQGGDRRGAGLGLAIAKGIVDAHGGRMNVESTPGLGSTFSFTLRRASHGPSAPDAIVGTELVEIRSGAGTQ